MANFSVPTGVILLVVVGIIAYIVYTSPQTTLPTHDFTNWTGYNGMYSGSVTGIFVGTVGTRGQSKWSNMVGQFDGTCNIQGIPSDCFFNISSGEFSGSISSGVLSNVLTANLSGTATWNVLGYTKRYEAPAPPSQNNIIQIVVVIAVIAGIIYYLTKESHKRVYLDNAKITDMLKKHLKERGWGVTFKRVVRFSAIPETGPSEQVRIHFKVLNPYEKDMLACYDNAMGNINVVHMDPTWQDIQEYMTLKIRFVQEQTVKKGFEQTKEGVK
jgi:uncharacterized membrane protein